MDGVVENILHLKQSLPEHVKLIPISKTMPDEKILQAWSAGFKVFGENKVQELMRKQQSLPDDIQWHMVGHLQSNKVKYIAAFVHLIHGIDSLKLLKIINKEAGKCRRIIRGLFQIHIASEETKFGFNPEEVHKVLSSEEYAAMENIKIVGVMGMATYTDDTEQVRREFQKLHSIYLDLKKTFFPEDPGFCEISMGMSGDYSIAIEEGSTMIRIGSMIFGPRQQK